MNAPWLVFLALATVLEIVALIGLVRSRRERDQDRRRRAAFIGFSAASFASSVSVMMMSVVYWLGPVRFRCISPFSADVVAVSSIFATQRNMHCV